MVEPSWRGRDQFPYLLLQSTTVMRTPTSDIKTGLKKGSWSREEDQMLISYISRYGIWNWSQMPRFAGK
ncbi:Homeodomain-like protein [Cynara cardunculus var. scolymus]|uniref:Homeodomain-like protein n=1 Tax=Cynara cardunculus var. scolymus TaxID=59895 RepID=A0A103XU95_CYNCS|nr:Homeodomain-like protein [Cynara cardunculus var. scolymus]